MNMILLLADGSCFTGQGFGDVKESIGEIVFNTSMTGYQEIVTDSSYYGQIVLMTYPLIGNYGINEEDYECKKIHANGMIVRNLCQTPSNFRSENTLNAYLKKNHVPGISGLDTRQITRIIREKGTMNGGIFFEKDFDKDKALKKIHRYQIKDPVGKVTTKKAYRIEGRSYRIAVIDLGIKQNILRSLQKRNMDVTIYPATVDAPDIIKGNYDGVILTNGPGNPKDCQYVIDTVQKIIGKIPIFGICLGHQIVALSLGGDTIKMRYGHRGGNHPVKDIIKQRTYITSQNHGYAVVKDSLKNLNITITHNNLNDETVEGIMHNEYPVKTVQFHPEASPGPLDTGYLFDTFVQIIKDWKEGKYNA